MTNNLAIKQAASPVIVKFVSREKSLNQTHFSNPQNNYLMSGISGTAGGTTKKSGTASRPWFLPLLFALAFCEGGIVMVLELLGAKAVAPYYGTSLYVWASTLGVTVGALAVGYFLGGGLSRRFSNSNNLITLFALAGLFTWLLPLTVRYIFPLTFGMELRPASTLGLVCYLFPPVVCLGAISPVIIQLADELGDRAGRVTGAVYATSTLGGVLATLSGSFYLIPYVGINRTVVMAASALTVLTLLLVAFRRSMFGNRPGAPAPQSGKSRTGKVRTSIPLALLLLISFLEGGALMITELLGAKITAPYYGTSLHVWGAVLTVTLVGLALGYRLGGWLSGRPRLERNLFVVLLLGAFLIAIGPLIGPFVLLHTDNLGIRAGALTAVALYLLPPVLCMGMVSPMITQLAGPVFRSGQAAGTVYAVSTVGGILATFLAGFVLIPFLGIRLVALLTAGVLGGMALVYFLLRKQYTLALGGFIMALLVIMFIPSPKQSDQARVVYHSSGILGEWTVLDIGGGENQQSRQIERKLLLNGIDQTYTQVGYEPLSLWPYPHKIGAYASMKPAGSKALLLGMGGGSIAFELLGIGMDLDIVEMDQRIPLIAERFFRYQPNSADIFIDDARHYIRTTPEKYDVVIVDLLHGEVQPAHMFSLEGFQDLGAILNEGALVIINFQGNIYLPEYALGPRSVYKTLLAAGFKVRFFSTPPRDADDSSSEPNLTKDIFFIASRTEHDYQREMENLRYNDWFAYDNFTYEDLIREDEIPLDDAILLVDDRPQLELLNTPTILQWRKNKMEQNIRDMLEKGIPIF